jgi:hypothetical protein
VSVINKKTALELRGSFGKNQDLFERLYLRKNGTSLPRKYDENVRKFSVTLHYYSPRAYNYVRKYFDNCLPHVRTLASWYCSIDGSPGFTKEALHVLKLRSELLRETSDKTIVCSLIFDEMAIRKYIEWDGQRYHGFVDMGATIDFASNIEAKEVLVFMLVAINDTWKVPVGYFMINSLNSEQKASLVTQCLALIKECNVVVTNVTFDGCPANFRMASALGCNLSIHNLDPCFGVEKTNILPNPSHMCKLIRNTFGEKRKLIDAENGIIDFSYVEQLNELQESEGLHIANNLRRRHIQFFKQKMKVKLATQLLSRSVAEALLFCRDQLRIRNFENCGPTAKFILIMNDAFDILNSKNLRDFGLKQAVCHRNIQDIQDFSLKFEEYVKKLKFTSNSLVIESNRKTGFLGFSIGLRAILNIYKEYIYGNSGRKLLQFLPVYKCSQDHLELYFSDVRSQLGRNDNPTCRQFKSCYKKLLVHNEVSNKGIGNCIPLDQINILSCYSAKHKVEYLINAENVIYNDIHRNGDDQSDVLFDHDYFFTENALTNFSEQVVIYILVDL